MPASPLRVYRAPWEGELVLVCRKCQKKMRKRGGVGPLAKVRRWFKKRRKQDDTQPDLRVVEIPCVKLCPKGGVTAFSAKQLTGNPGGVSILRSAEDLEAFYCFLRDAELQERG